MPDFSKYTKAECDYGPGKWPEECGTCAHFIAKGTTSQKKGYGRRTYRGDTIDNGTCKIVIGRIGEKDLCKFHVYDKKKDHLEEQEDISSEFGDIPYDIGRRTPPARAQRLRRSSILGSNLETGKEWCEICKMWHDPGHTH